MIENSRHLLIALVFIVMSGCTAMTTISSTQPGVSIRITDKSYVSMPVKDEFSVTTFGNYEFLAEKDGQEPLYGILPLKVNGGYIALDVLFFAPAVFFNAREVYPYYEIDIEKSLIRYGIDNMNLTDWKILPEESEQAIKYYKKANEQKLKKER